MKKITLQPGESVVIDGRRTINSNSMPMTIAVTDDEARQLVEDRRLAGRERELQEEARLRSPASFTPGSLQQRYAEILLRNHQAIPENHVDLARAALATAEGFAAIAGLYNASILSGWRAANDTTAGWTRRVELPNFLPTFVAIVQQAVKLTKLPSGKSSASVAFGISEDKRWRQARFSAQAEFAEEDLIDSPRVLELAGEELGAAAGRLISDMVYSLILANGNLADGIPLFHADRGNLSTGASVFSADTLGAAFTGIADQVLPVAADDDAKAHVNLRPRFVIVPPGECISARSVVRTINLGDENDLVVRTESRLGSHAFIDPDSDELVQPNGKQWLVAAAADQAASILVGTRTGKSAPTVTTYKLKQGKWGVGLTVHFDVGVTAVAGEPLFLTVGE